MNLDVLKQLIEDLRLTIRCLLERLECTYATVETHLKALGKTSKYGVRIPNELSPRRLQLRVDACIELMMSHRNCRWLQTLITGDEKWVLYVNYTCKRQWLWIGQTGVATPWNELHSMEIILGI